MLKSTGIIRKVDELGRVVIPIELRNKLHIVERDPIEIFVDGSSIVLRKYEPNCVFCGSTKGLSPYKDKLVCKKCANQITDLFKDNNKEGTKWNNHLVPLILLNIISFLYIFI